MLNKEKCAYVFDESDQEDLMLEKYPDIHTMILKKYNFDSNEIVSMAIDVDRMDINLDTTQLSGVENLLIKKRTKKITTAAFIQMKNLKNVKFEDYSLVRISEDMFRFCDKIENVQLPKGLRGIGDGAFESCTSLKNLNLPEGLTKIGPASLAGCYKLIINDLPDSLNDESMNVIEEHKKLVQNYNEAMKNRGSNPR